MEVVIASIIISTVAGILGTRVYYKRTRMIQRKMRKTDFKRIHNIQDGEVVTVAGNVEFFKHSINSPLTGRECVFYHVTVERKKSSGKYSHWVKEIDEASCVDFFLDDGDDIALVEASAVEGYLEMDKNFRSGAFQPASPEMDLFLKKYNFSSKGVFGINKALRYREGALEKHEYVVVCGSCHWESAADHGIEDREKILVIRSTTMHPLYISDVEDVLV